MMDDLHHGSKVTLFLEYAGFNINKRKQFIGIHQIEIAGESKIACRNIISFYKRMAELYIISSLGSVAQVAQKQFTHHRDMAL